MLEVKSILQGSLIGEIMSIQRTWMEDIAEKKHVKKAVIPGMEPTGHYWLNLGAYLQDQGMMKPVHVNPHHVKKSKELDDNNPNKNDRKDPKRLRGWSMQEGFRIRIFQQGFMWRSEICQTCAFRHRKTERRCLKEGKDPGISCRAQNRKYRSTGKCQNRDPKPVERL